MVEGECTRNGLYERERGGAERPVYRKHREEVLEDYSGALLQ